MKTPEEVAEDFIFIERIGDGECVVYFGPCATPSPVWTLYSAMEVRKQLAAIIAADRRERDGGK